MSNLSDVGDLFDLYFELREDTESPYIFHRWAMLTCIAAGIARNLYIRFGDDNIYPNTYCVLLGASGSRKSTAITQAANLLQKAGYAKFAGDKSSPEKFISDLAVGFDAIGTENISDINLFDQFDSNSKDVLIKASELEEFLGPNNGQFTSLLTHLWDNPDNYRHRTQTRESQNVDRPTVSMLGGATSESFKTVFAEGIIGQGMLSRMLVVHAPNARKKVPFPSTPDAEIEGAIVDELSRILRMKGEVKLTEEAKQTWGELYKSFNELDDERLESYSSRRHTHLLKICIVLAAMNGRYEITRDDIIYANSVLTYTEKFMSRGLGEFGGTEESRKMVSLLKLIKKHPQGINMKDLTIGAVEVGISLSNLGVLLTSLVHLKKVDRVEHEGMQLVVASHSKILNDTAYCDFSILREYTSTNGKDLIEPEEITVNWDFSSQENVNNDSDFKIQ